MFTLSHYYISNIRLVKEDNTEFPLEDKVVLVKHGVATKFDLGAIEPGSYKGVRFDIGIDPTTNHSDPAAYSGDHPLAVGPDSTMYCGRLRSYFFVNIEGMVDYSFTPDSTLDGPMLFHLGTDQLLRSVEILRSTFEATAGKKVEFVIEADHAAFFDGVNLAFQINATPFDNPLLATKVMDNVATSFR